MEPEIFCPDCDYLTFNQNDEFAPKDGKCASCYRYEICKSAYERDKPII